MVERNADAAHWLERLERLQPLTEAELQLIGSLVREGEVPGAEHASGTLEEDLWTLRAALLRALRSQPWSPESDALWIHSVVVSELARALAPRLSVAPELAGVLGLLQDVGRLGVMIVQPSAIRAAACLMAQGSGSLDAERRIFGLRAPMLSVLVGRAWRLPPRLAALLHSLDSVEVSPPPVVTLVLAADHLASLLGCPAYETAMPAPLPHDLESRLGLLPREWRELASVGARARARARQLVAPDAPSSPEEEDALGIILASLPRLARLHAATERGRRDLQDRAADTHALLAAFSSLHHGLDADSLRFRILESLLDHYRVDGTFLLEGESSGQHLGGYTFRRDPVVGAEHWKLRCSFLDFPERVRGSLLAGRTVEASSSELRRSLAVRLGDPTRCWMAPLQVRGCFMGVLGLLHAGEVPWGEQETADYLSMLAAAAALGLENVRLYEEVCHAANCDPLTGVSTRRLVMEELETLARRAGGDTRPFGVLLVDLDHFKAVNDTLGHQAGDAYLLEVVEAIRSCLGERDRLGRFGGDEFLIILPDADLARSEAVAQRIVDEVMQRARGPRWSMVPARLSATVGLAWWDGGAIDSAALTALADSSLYGAKSKGRSRVGLPALREVSVR
jgi:diguanylate cyclase (GGDEF)-like protein